MVLKIDQWLFGLLGAIFGKEIEGRLPGERIRVWKRQGDTELNSLSRSDSTRQEKGWQLKGKQSLK